MSYPLDFSRQIDDGVRALLAVAGGFFDGFARVIDGFAGGLEQAIGALNPWGLVVLAVGLGLWRIGKAFAIFALLADPGRHQSFDGSGMVKEAKNAPQRVKLGDEFGMAIRLGVPYSTLLRLTRSRNNTRAAMEKTLENIEKVLDPR